jgi:hypothetical protein
MFIMPGGSSNPQPCKYAAAVLQLAEPIFAHAQEYTTLEQFESSQQTLLARYLSLKERMETTDTLHFPSFLSNRHLCLGDAYEQVSSNLRTLQGVVKAARDTLQPNQDELPIGVDDELPDLEDNP